MTYAFVCRTCTRETYVTTHMGTAGVVFCPRCGDIMSRDYSRESVHAGAELRRKRNASAGGERYLKEQAKIENRRLNRDAVKNRGDA